MQNKQNDIHIWKDNSNSDNYDLHFTIEDPNITPPDEIKLHCLDDEAPHPVKWETSLLSSTVVTTMVQNETNRATTAETALRNALTQEITRATNREIGIEQELNNCCTNANNAIGQLQSSVTSLENSTHTLQSDLGQEISRATNRENEIERALNECCTNANNSIQQLQTNVTNLQQSQQNIENRVHNLEQNSGHSVDLSSINNAISDLQNRSTTLENGLNSERTDRTQDESVLWNNILYPHPFQFDLNAEVGLNEVSYTYNLNNVVNSYRAETREAVKQALKNHCFWVLGEVNTTKTLTSVYLSSVVVDDVANTIIIKIVTNNQTGSQAIGKGYVTGFFNNAS